MDKSAGFLIFRPLAAAIVHKTLFPILTVALVSSGLLLSSGCATIVASGPDMVPVNTQPEGARVTLDGVPVGRTPMTVAFARKCDGVLGFDLDTYEHYIYDEDKVVNGWVFGNILFGGVIGLTVDLIMSNQGKYSTNPIYVELVPKEAVKSGPLDATAPSPNADKPRYHGLRIPIAIFSIRTPEELSEQASDFYDVLRAEVIKGDRYKVLPRETMKERLGEQKYLSLTDCRDRKCLSEAGKALEVEKVLIGDIVKAENGYSITLALYDLESKEVQWTDYSTAKLEADVHSAITELAQKMNNAE